MNFEHIATHPRWMGPFSPARGQYSGFRVRDNSLGVWNENNGIRSYWTINDAGVNELVNIVRGHWGGGRVLILPNGFVVKPLQADEDVGRRVLIGRISGSIKLRKRDGSIFNFSNPGLIHAGDPWLGPKFTGLECTLRVDGSLKCSWYHPDDMGRVEVEQVLRGTDPILLAGFCKARPGDSAGRVRISAAGHVITNRQERGMWVTKYVGWIDPASWDNWDQWRLS